MNVIVCQIGRVRHLLTRVETKFGFPVMGQSLRFLARVSMTGKLFSKLNRVAGENRFRRLAGEGMEQGQTDLLNKAGCSLKAGVTGLICGPFAREVESLGMTRHQPSRNIWAMPPVHESRQGVFGQPCAEGGKTVNGILHTGMDAPTLKLFLVRQGQFLSRHLLPE